MPSDIYDFFNDLQDAGVYDFVLPFLLIFTILFAILEKTKLLGTEGQNQQPRRNLNTMLAVIISLIAIIQTDIVIIMNTYLSKMALFIIIVLIFMLVSGLFGASVSGYTGGVLGFFFIIAILAVFWALSPGLGFSFPDWLTPTEQDRAWLFLIVALLLVIWFVTKKPKSGAGTPGDSALDKIIQGLKGGPSTPNP